MYTNIIAWLRNGTCLLESVYYNLTSLGLVKVIRVEPIELNWSKSEWTSDFSLQSHLEFAWVEQVKVLLGVVWSCEHSLKHVYFILVDRWWKCNLLCIRISLFSALRCCFLLVCCCNSRLSLLLSSVNHSLLSSVKLLLIRLHFFIGLFAHSRDCFNNFWVLLRCSHLVPSFVYPLAWCIFDS